MGLSRCMVSSLGIQRRTGRFKISRMPSGSLPLGRWRSRRHKRRKILRPRRPSFRQTPRTHSMPRGVPKRPCRLPDNAFLRMGYDDQIHNDPSGPEPRRSERISGETIAVRHPQEPISTPRRVVEFASLRELVERVEPAVSMNGAYRRNVRPYGMVKKERGRLPTSGESAANALDRWDEEGGAAARATRESG